MASTGTASRIGGAALAALVNGGLVAALLWGLGAPIMRIVERPIDVFDIAPPPPETPRIPPPAKSETRAERRATPGREGAAAPANIVGRASEIVAPPPLVRLPLPPPITAAPMPDDGTSASSGAARVRGPGTGAGGVGDGRGAGTGGNGTGGGGGWSDDSPPRLLRELRPSDYPKAAAQAGIGGTVGVIYTIDTRGRAIDCRITRSSGDRRLDIDTCMLIEKRYRYDPSRDPEGRPVASRIEHDMIWNMEMLPPEPNEG